MTQEITAEQATRIHDLPSYREVLGVERFKRTAKEMQLGLDPEAALKRRLAAFDPNWLAANPAAKASVDRGITQAKAGLVGDGPTQFRTHIEAKFVSDQAVIVKPGDVVIRIRAVKGVSPDYFEHLPQTEIVVEQDSQFYGWLDVKLGSQYSGEAANFFTEVLNQGLGELIDRPKFAAEPQETVAEGHNNEN
jgi:hypothetical protein